MAEPWMQKKHAKRRPLHDVWWERQKRETQISFAKFVGYRDLGSNRSLAKLRRALGNNGQKISLTRLEQLSAQWHWVARAEAWDAELERQGRQAQVEAVRDMNKRHTDLALAVQSRIAERLRAGLSQISINDMDWHALLRALVEATKLERLARGEPSSVVDMRIKIRREAERIAEAHGLSVDEVMSEADAILKDGDGNRNG